jgi:hypothetical protein
VRLTKRAVEALPIADSEYFVLDADLPGFALRVYPSGKRYYAVHTRLDRIGPDHSSGTPALHRPAK